MNDTLTEPVITEPVNDDDDLVHIFENQFAKRALCGKVFENGWSPVPDDVGLTCIVCHELDKAS